MTKLVFTIIDGFGYRTEVKGNAILRSKVDNLRHLWNCYPHCLLDACGSRVGLPDGQMGNSEVGHLNIGAGRVVYQPLEMINRSIDDGLFFDNDKINDVIDHVLNNGSKLHIFGLLSDGGVHSHIDHLFALIDLCKKRGVEKVCYHVFLDGRDTLPNLKDKYLKMLLDKVEESGVGSVSTVCGRYYAMDRDNRWDRIKMAYDAIVFGVGNKYDSVFDLVCDTDSNGVTDEFVIPSVVSDGTLADGDGLIVFNFRPDRLRELFSAITNPDFDEFETKRFDDIKLVTMMDVSDEVVCTNAFRLDNLKNTFGEYISSKGFTQLRIAETEKYAHVTYFFDGGVLKELDGCDRILIPSPKVVTYDLKPEMSADLVTDTLLDVIDDYDVVILNFANCDMVGHTGDMDATIKAIETVDRNIGRIYDRVLALGATLVVSADHGNCDCMIDDDGNVVTSHTMSKVPFIVCDNGVSLSDGKLGDVAPTLLSLLGLDVPLEMTGDNLICK